MPPVPCRHRPVVSSPPLRRRPRANRRTPKLNEQRLGRLQRVELRAVWKNEPTEFTPWLAEPENLQILGETLGLELEPSFVEKEVGSFRADIVCKEIGTDSSVLIENQLEKTNHDHLGKLLTYAAGLQAVTVVWLAEGFRDEHRAALDWLNEITHRDARFFGLEIELWQIGDSPAAPKFNIVSMPNDWSRSVTRRTRTPDDAELSELKVMQRKYWTGLQDKLTVTGGPVRGNRKPQPQSWMPYGIGVGGFRLAAVMNTVEKFLRVELYIFSEDANERLGLLERNKDEIERKFGYPLKWGDQSPAARDRRIAYYLRDVDLAEESDWPRQHDWLAKHLNEMHHAFAQQVRDL